MAARAGATPIGTAPLTLKLEQLHCSGWYKARGAFANLLTRDVPPAGVVAASGGNHGVAVAHAAAQLGLPAHVFVPTVAAAPAAAVGVAALRSGANRPASSQRVGVVITGANSAMPRTGDPRRQS